MNYIDVLREAGFPEQVLMLDFETYFDSEYHMGQGKAAISTSEYVADDRFEVLGFGFRMLNHPWESLGSRFVPQPKVKSAMTKLREKCGKALHNVTVAAKNCKFDVLILEERFGICPPFTVDVEDLTRTYNARMSQKLKDVAPMFGLPHKGETKQFKGQHFNDLDLKVMEAYCCNDIDLQVELFKRLMPIVKNPKLELWLAAHTLRLFTRPTAHFDFDLASRIRADMQEEIDRAIADIAPWIMEQLGFTEEDIAEATELGVVGEIVQEELSKNLRFCKYLLDLGVDIPTKPGKPSKNMIPMTGEGMIPALAKDDEGTKLLIGHEDDTVRQLMQGRLAVKSWPNWIGRIDKLEAQARASRGLVRVPLKYYGAHTGRFSGEEKVNLGNLGGSGRGKEISKLIGEIRHTICAPPGCLFILVDSAQIEARKLAWLAGQLDLLDEFRNDGDPYSTLASQLFGCRVWKWRDDDVEEYPGQKKKITIYRGFGKDAILGCGYGMGASTFYDRCYANDELRPHFDSGEFDVRFIQNLIDTYRTTYPKIPEYWRRVERAWWLATKYKEPQDVDGRVHFWHKDGTTFMRLPSGRIMRYFDAKVNAKNELRSSTCKTQNNPAGKLWGGTITENIDQAASRDALVFWIQEVEKAGVHVVHHVYDEIIAVAPECDAESVMNTMMDIMETKPDWAEGVPYKAKGEGKISPYYVK